MTDNAYKDLNDFINATLDVTVDRLVEAGMNTQAAAWRGMAFKSIAALDGMTCDACKKDILEALRSYIDALLEEIDGAEHLGSVH